MRIAYLTAGAAGMYCGSCMHDNALARELQRQGVDCILQPVYTPIRTDEIDVSSERVFFGGIQIYLLQKMPWLRWVPSGWRRWLDSPRLLRWATQGSGDANVKMLGQLTVSMLQGLEGRQRDEVQRLVDWLADELRPTSVILSNLLIGGVIPALRQRMPDASVLVTLQGDDIFIDHLPEPYRGQVIAQMQALVPDVDRFIVHSRFYADKMSRLLKIPPEKLVVLPLAIDAQPFADWEQTAPPERSTLNIGYLARLAPEKGLHHLVDAFIDLSSNDDGQSHLHIAGWQGSHHDSYVAELKTRLTAAGRIDRVRFHGSPDLAGKQQFLRSIDVLCVPTEYEDPKGLFVLEAWAAGVPVVQPDHGAFSELLSAGEGGVLVPPRDPQRLARELAALIADHPRRLQLGAAGRTYVLSQATISKQAAELLAVIENIQLDAAKPVRIATVSG